MVKTEKIDLVKIAGFKKAQRKISALTAYDYSIARLLDESGIDLILVGDSGGNVALGHRNTLPVSMDEMTIFTRAAARAVKRAFLIADLPFGAYQVDPKEAVRNAIALAKAGAEAVKLEGVGYLGPIRAIIKAGIPVMGHLGFTPQSVNELGYHLQGKDPKAAARLMNDAKKLEQAGCFAIVLEMMPPELAKRISRTLKIPTIGIGAGPFCDGQVLVTYDMLGLYPDPPKFVNRYADVAAVIKKAVKKYISEIGNKTYINLSC
ncbi:MAG TPA: 3-methyl-2-oxobutanoate hydroxymethyltransferase [Candidatus Omnitrophota bacterium]|nr:3-methyl-2-oxobutanoate hydroxymethyltransferase [Candidatus Omnitrophota bacterium]